MMNTKETNPIEILKSILIMEVENEVIEFKSARTTFSFDDLGRYFCALSNEANLKRTSTAWMVLGVDNDRNVVGTEWKRSYTELQKLKQGIADKTNGGITFRDIYELHYLGGRVILFEIPAALLASPFPLKVIFMVETGILSYH